MHKEQSNRICTSYLIKPPNNIKDTRARRKRIYFTIKLYKLLSYELYINQNIKTNGNA